MHRRLSQSCFTQTCLALICALSALVACDDADESADPQPDMAVEDAHTPLFDVGGADAGADAALPELASVPWTGQLSPLDVGDLSATAFPVAEGAEWRYRPQTADWQAPPPPSRGAVVTLSPGMAEDEWIREVISVYESTRGEAPQRIWQRVVETWIVDDATPDQGISVYFKRTEMEERVLETRAFVKSERREYEPPYLVIKDTRNPNWDPQLRTDCAVKQAIQLSDDVAPNEVNSSLTVQVQAAGAQAIPMENVYREPTYEISITDKPGGRVNRTLWVQPGAGVVQFSYGPEQENATFTLMATNIEGR
ncbi:hypothetical protein KKF91_16335 [Myxococcota bacterium]|nr:hypothetical protein [Myxococcota bacterium]MBU1432104.1 hypothetical protein [Myxococcota bacterium]MBU1900683.1 hypothetical protein [Myxococcota bacterium]